MYVFVLRSVIVYMKEVSDWIANTSKYTVYILFNNIAIRQYIVRLCNMAMTHIVTSLNC